LSFWFSNIIITIIITFIEVSPYITKLIIEIVKIHSQITDISRKLQHTMLSEIFLNLVQDLLEAFREIDHYSVAGMLQVIIYIIIIVIKKKLD